MKNLNKVTSSLICAILFMGSANASLPETWYEKEVGERKIKKSYQKIAKSYSDEDLKVIFDSRKLQACELNVMRELNKLDTKYLDDAVIRANKLGYIDEIETDILLQYAEAMDSVPKRMESNSFRIRKGKKRVEDMYRNLFAGDRRQNVESNRSSRRTRAFCLANVFPPFLNEVNKIVGQDESQYIMQYLNHYAKRKNIITQDQLDQIEVLRILFYNPQKLFSIKDYKRKQGEFKRAGYEINTRTTEFHIDQREEGALSVRSSLYTKYSKAQIEDMVDLLQDMTIRLGADKTHIVFSKIDDVVIEKVKLTHTEKFRASVKLYQREKRKMMQLERIGEKYKDFSYKEHIALAYELGLINDVDVQTLSNLQKEVKERTLLQKGVSEARKYGVFAAALGGATAGFVYTLIVSIADSYINKDAKAKPNYDHDLMYGLCGDSL